MQRATRTGRPVPLSPAGKDASEVLLLYLGPSREKSERSSATSAVASPSDFHGLGKLHARDRALPVAAWHLVMEGGARIGMTTACTAFAMVSVEPWLHWSECGWKVVLALRKRRKDNLAAHGIARVGLFLSHT